MKKYSHNAPKLKGAHRKLRVLYKKIPSTTGCMDNLDTCKSWCCSCQSPQVLYVEFLHTWKDVLKYWALPDILDLIEHAINAYLNNNPVKGCIFHNKETGLCTQHKTRCFNCYIYGITPKDKFTERFNRFKEMYKDRPDVILHDQCPLVEAKKKVTQKDIDKWWNELVDIEKSIGIKKKNINDKDDGSYRSYHDHLLLYLFPDVVLNQMTIVKGTITDPKSKEACVRSLMDCLKGNIETLISREGNERIKKD